MVKLKEFFNIFKSKKIVNFYGVPDSLLKDFIEYLNNKKDLSNIISVNEGAAVSSAIGHYLASKKMACVYMQNSGLGNSINPLISIAHPKVYSIPMVLIIGWRGAPNEKDEPQHQVKGKITIKLLNLLNIKYLILDSLNYKKKIESLIKFSKRKSSPVAILVKKDTFKKEKIKNKVKTNRNYTLTRESFIKNLLKVIKKKDLIISTTGYTSRELYQIRKKTNLRAGKDFYMVGGMGHSSSVSLGASLSSKKRVICLDGDGSILMHLGALHTVSNYKRKNLKIILLNNYSHESVGGQKTYSEKIDFNKMIKGFGFKSFIKIKDKKNLSQNINNFLNSSKNSFMEVQIKQSSIENLERPKNLINIKKKFMQGV